MAKNNIQQKFILQQDVEAEIIPFGNGNGRSTRMFEKQLTKYIHDIIREYAQKDINCGYSLFFNDLPFEEKKIFLSKFLHIDDYEEYTRTPTSTIAAIEEYASELNYLIKQELDEVYHQDMAEMGIYMQRTSGGDYFWVKK